MTRDKDFDRRCAALEDAIAQEAARKVEREKPSMTPGEVEALLAKFLDPTPPGPELWAELGVPEPQTVQECVDFIADYVKQVPPGGRWP